MLVETSFSPSSLGWSGFDSLRRSGGLEPLINELRSVVYALADCGPDETEGDAWLTFDNALRGLESALVALEQVERDSHAGSLMAAS